MKDNKLCNPWIDVFIIYGFPDNVFQRKIHYLLMSFYHKMYKLSDRRHILNRKRPLYQKLIISAAGIIHTENILSKERMLEKMVGVASKYNFNVSNYVGAFPTWYGYREVMPRSYYGDGLKHDFSDVKLKIPEDYDKYLQRLYGNYMELPPIGERKGKHRIIIKKRNLTQKKQY